MPQVCVERAGRFSPRDSWCLYAVNERTTDADLKRALTALPGNVSEVRLQSCSELSAKMLAAVAAGVGRSLVRLDLRNCTKLNSKALLAFATHCPSLRHVSIDRAYLVGDKALSKLAQQCPLLETVSLDYCVNIGDRGVAPLVQLEHLRLLHLTRCRISDSLLQDIAHAPCCTSLEDLGMSYTDISDVGIRALCTRPLPKLHRLDARGCSRLTDVSVHELAHNSGAPLVSLDVYMCPLVTKSAFVDAGTQLLDTLANYTSSAISICSASRCSMATAVRTASGNRVEVPPHLLLSSSDALPTYNEALASSEPPPPHYEDHHLHGDHGVDEEAPLIPIN